MRIKISLKEAKECRLWLRLSLPNETNKIIRDTLIQETNELRKIFCSILDKSK